MAYIWVIRCSIHLNAKSISSQETDELSKNKTGSDLNRVENRSSILRYCKGIRYRCYTLKQGNKNHSLCKTESFRGFLVVRSAQLKHEKWKILKNGC